MTKKEGDFLEAKQIRLSPKKNGAGYVTSYSINLGTAEVRECGFFSKDGIPLQLEKLIDKENKQIIIRLAETES